MGRPKKNPDEERKYVVKELDGEVINLALHLQGYVTAIRCYKQNGATVASLRNIAVENECAKCDLVLPLEDIVSAYKHCIELLQNEIKEPGREKN